MSPELATRLVVVGLVIAFVAVTAWYFRRRDRLPMRKLGRVDLDPGIYLFTSTQCLECVSAREFLSAQLGKDGFVEMSWENNKEQLDRYRIDAVPATLAVDGSHHGRVWFGKPPRTIFAGDP